MPKERAFFRRLVDSQDDAAVAYPRMVSVSVDTLVVQSAFRAGLGAGWTFLSDAARRYVDELDLRETTDTFNEPYLPVVFTLFPDLTIQRVYRGYWFWGRPTLDELREDLSSRSGTGSVSNSSSISA